MLTINTNVASLQAQKNLNGTQFALNKSIDHLSAGLRITSGADDAVGLAAAMTKQGTIGALRAAAQSTQTGIAQVQTIEGYMNEATNILIRLEEIGTGSVEAIALGNRLDDIGDSAALSAGVTGVIVDETGTLTVGTTSTFSNLSSISTIGQVAAMRADLGATANVLTGALGTIQTAIANNSAVVSAIQDVDVAEETSKLARAQVLAQAGVAALAQANQLPQMALKLLG
jgi:flagellin